MRNRALGVRFYRQKVVGPFIPDFVCERPKLIVEVDGPVHQEQLARTRERQAFLEARGDTVLRVSANEAQHDLDHVLGRIAAALVTKRERDVGEDARRTQPSRFRGTWRK